MIDEINVVRKEWGCPLCGERRTDYLVCRDEEKEVSEQVSDVECVMCGNQYRISLAPTIGEAEKT